MPQTDPDQLLALLRDPNVASAEIAEVAGVSREEAGRAARVVTTVARVDPAEVVDLPAPLAAAVLRAASGAGRLDLLAALAARTDQKELAKEAKRLLHLLKVRGVAVPEPARAAAPSAQALPSEPPPPAYATTPDGTGERAVWLARPVPGRGLEIAQAVVSDERGLVELRLGTLGRKEWRAFVKGLAEKGAALGLDEIDRGQAHALLVAARTLNGPAGTRPPDGADHWLGQLGQAPALAVPGATLPPPDTAVEATALAGSASLRALPLLRGWLADPVVLSAVARRLDEANASTLELTPDQRRERRSALLREAAEADLTPARRTRLASRLLVVADHLLRTDRDEAAGAAAAVARALAAGRPAAEIPFALGLVEAAFPDDADPVPFDPAAAPR
jgi:hypothetical protein